MSRKCWCVTAEECSAKSREQERPIDPQKLADLLRTGLLSPVYHGENGVRSLKELAHRNSRLIWFHRCTRLSRFITWRCWITSGRWSFGLPSDEHSALAPSHIVLSAR